MKWIPLDTLCLPCAVALHTVLCGLLTCPLHLHSWTQFQAWPVLNTLLMNVNDQVLDAASLPLVMKNGLLILTREGKEIAVTSISFSVLSVTLCRVAGPDAVPAFWEYSV